MVRAKVRCKVCANENNGICKVKNIGIKINKDRICDGYVYDEIKMKANQAPPVIRINCAEYEEERKRLKAERAEIRKFKTPLSSDAHFVNSIPIDVNSKYPLTGDLSRFVSTAVKNTD